MEQPPLFPPERSGSWAKDHCDYLLDSIDAQLSQLQAQGPRVAKKSNGMTSLDRNESSSSAADLGLGGFGIKNGEALMGEDSSFWKEERAWWPLDCLLDVDGPSGGQSESDSVCTEDFMARFQDGLVDPLLSSCGEEDALAAGVLLDDSEHTVHYQETCDVLVGNIRDSSARNEILGHGSMCSEEKFLKIQKNGDLLESQQRIEDKDISYDWVQDTQKNSNSPLFVEDLGSSHLLQVPNITSRMTIPASETPLQTDGQSCPQKGPSDCSKVVPGIACLCPFQAHQNCVQCSGGEARGGPWRLSCDSPRDVGGCPHYPVIVCDANKRPKPALPGLGITTWVDGVARESPHPGNECCMKRRESRTMKAHERKCDGASGLMKCGNLGAQNHEPHLNVGHLQCAGGVPVKSFSEVTIDSDLDSVRTESVQGHFCRVIGRKHASGHTRKLCSPQKDLLGDLGSTDTGEEEEEEEEHDAMIWRRSCPKQWTRSKRVDPGWKGTKNGAFQSAKASSITGHGREDPPNEDFVTNLVRLEESVMKLQQELDTGDEKLSQEKVQIHEADESLLSLLQQKERMALELKTLQEALEDSQKEARRLELHLKENQEKVDEARANLVLLEYKRDACLRELLKAEEELSALRRQCSQYGALQAEVSRLATERTALKVQVRHLEDNLSSLKLRLQKCQTEQASADAQSVHLQEVAQAARELDRQIQGLELRISALQKVLSEKELELSRLRKAVSALEAEKEAQVSSMEDLKQEHMQRMRELQLKKETEVNRLQEALKQEKQQMMQEFAESTAKAKADALREQAATFQKDLENLRRTIEDRDAELIQQRQAMYQQEWDLKQESKEMVRNSLLQEKEKWEDSARAALRVQRETLEEHHQKAQADLQNALEKEKKSGCDLQVKVADLSKRNQELESQICSLQREKQAAMEELRELLQEEKAEGLRRLQEEMEQERMHEKEQMRMRLQQVEEDLRLLQAKQSEMSLRGQESQAHMEWADRSLAREVTLACQRLQDLLPKKSGMPNLPWMTHGSPGLLSTSRAMQALQELSIETKHYLQDLRHKMELQKHHVLQIQQEKELELRHMKEQLRLESQSALEALKERLVQEHMNDIAALQRNQAEANLMLHQQLQEKDDELRAIQGNMAHWKNETTHKLAHKFKEELDSELQKRLSQDKPTDFCRNLETPELEMKPVIMDRSKSHPSHSIGSALLCSALLTSRHSLSIPKLPHRLQNPIQDPRAGNLGYYTGSLDNLSNFKDDLGDTCIGQMHSISTLPSALLQSKGSKEK